MSTQGASAGGADDKRDMMTCQDLVELVTAYREGVLPPDERERFDAHLAACPPCVTYVEQLDLTVHSLGGLHDAIEDAPETQELLRVFREWKADRESRK
jgi:anti-sigma factor RsiW